MRLAVLVVLAGLVAGCVPRGYNVTLAQRPAATVYFYDKASGLEVQPAEARARLERVVYPQVHDRDLGTIIIAACLIGYHNGDATLQPLVDAAMSDAGLTMSTGRTIEKTQAGVLYGLVNLSGAAELGECGAPGYASVRESYGLGHLIVTWLTLGLYSPTSVTIECAAAKR